ncbi:ADAMTS-like protein 1 isoform X1 [Ruditapes philippinarum]|uniref:ADAMTS-like protein 1 isoform X1 n=1 Tax=Ruditapes philippinarum TaxID=129788 RepID=UPI00295B9BD0|nr:ADAMTS-like protein 1 isoform X1 [Ruditapes philippinarum]XP_060579732.1 ADAMTS-like protein 1 isoform X1 [Ruditapes philippinarum]
MKCIWILTTQLLVIAYNVTAEWLDWGEYGNCSRPCGGGLVNKTRTCLGATHTCTGTNIRYKVCNTQACGSEGLFIRDKQCQSFNNVSIKDNYFHWVPYYSSSEPCVLYCRTVETGFILKMQAQTWNGTACGKQSGGVCIGGRCKKVGCDDIVGSKRKLDPCGVCGGDGTSCDKTRDHRKRHHEAYVTGFQWDIGWSMCSKTCGKGIQVPFEVCKNLDTGEEVGTRFCSGTDKPSLPRTRVCDERDTCDFRWQTSKWGSCSRSCGDGFKYRRVVCVKRYNSSIEHVLDHNCVDAKPQGKTSCYLGDCPEWLTGPWSPCSVSCGYGQQKRKVVCRASSTDLCTTEHKPATVQKCFSGKSCGTGSFQQDDSTVTEHDFFDDAMLQDLFTLPRFVVSSWGPCSVTCGVGYRHRNVTCKKDSQVVPFSECEGTEPHSKRECHQGKCPLTASGDEAFVWRHRKFKPCSQTCGRGTQTSILECVDVVSNRTVVDFLCEKLIRPGPITQYCNVIDCPPGWRVSEYGTCSVPCGGGRQSRDIECVQMTSGGAQETLPLYRCPDPVPLSERSCNLKFCQAEWKTGSWAECSVTCGAGFESRPVFCVKHLKTNLQVNVSDSECIGPRPTNTRPCYFGDCYKLQQLPEIKERKGVFIQTKRSKRIRLYVGEKAILLPNQSVKIKCPVRNFHKKLIFWTKDHRLIPLVGRVRVSSNGALRITRANPKVDTGVFTCSAGLLHATVKVSFQSKREAKQQADTILNSIFQANFNGSNFQADGTSKMKNTKYLHINAIDENSGYDYSSFTTSNWTECSEKCGWGTQTRIVTCNHLTDKFIRLLPEEECLKRGLEKPTSTQKCIIESECPSWTAGEWSECTDEKCEKVGHSVQTRVVQCLYKNQTEALVSKCNIIEKPIAREHCKNPNCTAEWQTSKWSDCTPLCGAKGRKLRTLSCVWVSTKLPAYNVCRNKAKPSVSKTCKPAKCRHTETCVDNSSFCDLAGHLKMCRYHKFRWKCCKTCKQANIS